MRKIIFLAVLFCIAETDLALGMQPTNTNDNQEITKKMLIANQLYNRNQKFNVRDTYIRRSRPQMQQLVQPQQINPKQQQMAQQSQGQMPVVNTQVQNNQVQTCPTCKQTVNNTSMPQANNPAGHSHPTSLSQQVNNQQNIQQQANMKKFPVRKTVGFGQRKKRRFKYQ